MGEILGKGTHEEEGTEHEVQLPYSYTTSKPKKLRRGRNYMEEGGGLVDIREKADGRELKCECHSLSQQCSMCICSSSMECVTFSKQS